MYTNVWLQTTWKNITIPGIAKVYPPKTVITIGCNGIHTKVHILKNVVAQTTLDPTDCCYIDEKNDEIICLSFSNFVVCFCNFLIFIMSIVFNFITIYFLSFNLNVLVILFYVFVIFVSFFVNFYFIFLVILVHSVTAKWKWEQHFFLFQLK